MIYNYNYITKKNNLNFQSLKLKNKCRNSIFGKNKSTNPNRLLRRYNLYIYIYDILYFTCLYKAYKSFNKLI